MLELSAISTAYVLQRKMSANSGGSVASKRRSSAGGMGVSSTDMSSPAEQQGQPLTAEGKASGLDGFSVKMLEYSSPALSPERFPAGRVGGCPAATMLRECKQECHRSVFCGELANSPGV